MVKRIWQGSVLIFFVVIGYLIWPRPAFVVATSTSFYPLVSHVAQEVQKRFPLVHIRILVGGSYFAYAEWQEGVANLSITDFAVGTGGKRFAKAPFAVFSGPKTTSVSEAWLKRAFLGQEKRWPNGTPLHLINRPAASGTRAMLKKSLGLAYLVSPTAIALANGQMARWLSTIAGSLGYLEAGFYRPGMHFMTLRQPLWLYGHLYGKHSMEEMTFAKLLQQPSRYPDLVARYGYVSVRAS